MGDRAVPPVTSAAAAAAAGKDQNGARVGPGITPRAAACAPRAGQGQLPGGAVASAGTMASRG